MNTTYKILFLITFIATLFYTSLSFAQNTSATQTVTTTPQRQRIRLKDHNECLKPKIIELTKQMQTRKKEALNEFKNNLKNTTSTEARRELKRRYNEKIREINKWYNEELKKVKTECGLPEKQTKQIRLRERIHKEPITTSTTSTQQ